MASNINPSLTPVNNLANFRFWCQKVLPLVYDDSLSYYEVLGKMVVQLNDVIDNVNADTENVLTLKDAFLALQTYVNNFFDDIDQLASYAERAEAAQTAANTSAVNAATSASNASASSLAAMGARDTAVAARQAAQASANTASTAATNANTKANEAAQSAITAQTAQASASQSATLAATDRSAAQTAAATATSKASEANTSATNAAESATNAEQSKDDAQALVDSVQKSLDNIQQNTQDIGELKESFNGLNLFEKFFKDYLINDTTGPTGRKFKINGSKVEITGNGSSYYCCNLLSKTNTPHYGAGTSAQVTSFLNEYKNDILIPISALTMNYSNLWNFIVEFKNTFSEGHTNIRFHLCKCTEENDKIISIDNITQFGYVGDEFKSPCISDTFGLDTINNYTHFAIIIISRIGSPQSLTVNFSLITTSLINSIITSYVFNSFTATKAIPANTLILVGRLLYKTITSISNGAKLIIGDNITKTTLADELNN